MTKFNSTVCPGSSDPFYIVTYYIEWVTTSWTYSILVFSRRKKQADSTYQLHLQYMNSMYQEILKLAKPIRNSDG